MCIEYIKQHNILLARSRDLQKETNLWFPSKDTDSAHQIQTILILFKLTQTANHQQHGNDMVRL